MSSGLGLGASTAAEVHSHQPHFLEAGNEELKRTCDAETEQRGPGGEWMISAQLNGTQLNQDEAISTSFQLQSGNC